mgnify:CR=1 FL=1|jgi:hypothetical protein
MVMNKDKKKYWIKHAWRCNHELLGDVVQFIATPYRKTSPNSYGYSVSSEQDEVFRFSASSCEAKHILHRLAKVGNNLWSQPNETDLVEVVFNMNRFYEEELYQDNDNYKRMVVFHTDVDLC